MPSVRAATNFFLVLTLVADAVVVAGALLGLAALVSKRARARALDVARFVGPGACTTPNTRATCRANCAGTSAS